MNITSGVIQSAKKVLIYGPEGIGKTTIASKFPGVVFLDTEGGSKAMNVSRFDAPKNWNDIIDTVEYVIKNPECCKTLAIDTADWAEMFCIKYTCEKANMKGIEDFGYGKGYVYVMENFKQLLDQLDRVIEAGINVVFTAHAKMRKFEQPDEMGAYDRWETKLSKQVAPMIKEWADMVLFANYKTYVVEDDKTKSKKAQGGKRVMYTTHNPCWDAKNRYGLDDCIQFEYEQIKHIIERKEPIKVVKKTESAPAPEPASEPVKEERPEIIKLRELMAKDDVSEDAVILACSTKGVCFTGEPLEKLSPDFITNNLIDKWPGFLKYLKKLDENTSGEIPFNG